MLDFKPVKLEDKQLFDSYVKRSDCRNSETTFANMYIWKDSLNIQFAFLDKALVIGMDTQWYGKILFPPYLSDESESIAPYMEMCEAYMAEQGIEFYMKSVTNKLKERIEKDCPGRYVFSYDEYNSEYVYRTRDLIELKGKKYHSKRNHINSFLKNYTPEFEMYDTKYRDDCIRIQKGWAKHRQDDDVLAKNEMMSIERALDCYEALRLTGCVVKIDGEVVAFSVGERICPNMAVIHIEKARGGINGLYTYINREFAARVWKDCEYINREEDMGVEGIRKAKRSYHPIFMMEKYDVRIK